MTDDDTAMTENEAAQKSKAAAAKIKPAVAPPPVPAPKKDTMSRISDTLLEGLKSFQKVKGSLKAAADDDADKKTRPKNGNGKRR